LVIIFNLTGTNPAPNIANTLYILKQG